MFMASSWTGSWPLGVILTLRRDVFICGETEVMVPWTIVPACAPWSVLTFTRALVADGRRGVFTILQLNGYRLIGALHQKPDMNHR